MDAKPRSKYWNGREKGYKRPPFSEEWKLNLRLAHLGHKHTDATRKKMSASRRGLKINRTAPPWNKGKKGVYSRESLERFRLSHLGKKQSAETIARRIPKLIGRRFRWKDTSHIRGSNNHRWRGGLTEKHHLIRNSAEYKAWRRAIFQRDHFTCVIGGKAHGSEIEADHIKPFADYPELRFDVSNGRTLCKECHKNTPTYGVHKAA
jgi:5-methylcytosine-specific restriction endonuclease McrA